MIKLTKKTDAYWAGNGFGNEAAEWVVRGAEHLHVWSSGSGEWNVTDRETGERIIRREYGRANALKILAEKMPELDAA